MKLKLSLLNRLHPAQEFVLDQFPAFVGRGDEATVALPDRWVSRLHCRIDEIDGTLVVKDLSSKHGTFVNDCRVREAPLQSGDTLGIGMSTFEVVYEEQGHEHTLSPSMQTERE